MRGYSTVRFLWARVAGVLVVVAVTILVLAIWVFGSRKRSIASAPPVSMQMESVSEPVVTDAGTPQVICFLRDGWIYLLNVGSGKETRLVPGLSPSLSPTGDSVVFISVEPNEKILNRILPPPGRLRLLQIRTGEIRDFKTIGDRTLGDPVWSNIDSKIAFTTSANTKKRSIGILDATTENLKELAVDEIPSDEAIYLDSWTPDGRSLVFHTLSALYEMHVNDTRVEKLPFDDIFKSGEISSTTRFSFSSDRRYLVFDRIVDTSNEPQNEVSLLDLATKTVKRITPTGVRGRAPVWLPSNKEILFSRIEWRQDSWRSDICRIALDGTGMTTVARDADLVSYAIR